MSNSPVRPCLLAVFLLLAGSSGLAAAPGKLSQSGPFGVIAGPIVELAYPSADPRRILILTAGDLYETRDAGVTWRSVLASGLFGEPAIVPAKLLAVPGEPDHWYVAGHFEHRDLVIETRNAGRVWSVLAIPETSLLEGELGFFLDAAAPLNLVAAYQGLTGAAEYLVSQDGGASWARRLPPGDPGRFLGVDRGIAYTRNYRFELATNAFTPNAAPELRNTNWLSFDRESADILFANVVPGVGFVKSTDGGASFTPREGGRFGFAQSPVNPDHLAGSRGGVLKLSFDRGDTWIDQGALGSIVHETAFDPATGELVFATGDELRRRRADGTLAAPIPANGISAVDVDAIAVRGERTLMRTLGNRIYVRDEEGAWRPRGKVEVPAASGFTSCFGASTLLLLPGDETKAVAACSTSGVFTSDDGGWTWRKGTGARPIPGHEGFLHPPILRHAGGPGGEELFLLFRDDFREGEYLYRSTDLGRTWDWIGLDFREMAIHPAGGVIAVKRNGDVQRYSPADTIPESWQTIPGTEGLFRLSDPFTSDLAFGHDPAHPGLVYGITEANVVRSDDFGSTWRVVASAEEAFDVLGPYFYPEGLRSILRIAIDPFDSDHWLIPGSGLATRDGGRTFSFAAEADGLAAAFDPLVAGHFMTGSQTYGAGVYEITAALPACPDSAAAWCARGGRYLLTVDWKDPQGVRGKATRVDSGSEDSGLFYFFDPNNWELLVKVLDGCGINQRFWLLAAGTTDVEYVLKVEDRWTGQIRHYANAGGRAAPAVVDTDAFSGCGAAVPPGAPPALAKGGIEPETGGETSLLLTGRFEVKTRWTDFAGVEGDALTAPLRSESSGIFYFFSPDNWEMLVKVLDGCAINNHYWVLAAATTDVGYRMTVRETNSTRSKTYQNPVGRAAPALLDLQAFSCGS
jgi:hypothetical protein